MGAQSLSAALFVGLGILFQSELKQPMNGLSTGLKAVGEAEIVKLFQQLLFQAQVECDSGFRGIGGRQSRFQPRLAL